MAERTSNVNERQRQLPPAPAAIVALAAEVSPVLEKVDIDAIEAANNRSPVVIVSGKHQVDVN